MIDTFIKGDNRVNQSKKFIGLMKKVSLYTTLGVTGLLSRVALATGSQDIGAVASQVTSSFEKVTKLMTGGSYLAGLAFAIGAIMKFKQHKDNPTQIPIGTPIALLFIAAALLFLPSVLGVTGMSLFTGGGETSTPKGTIF